MIQKKYKPVPAGHIGFPIRTPDKHPGRTAMDQQNLESLKKFALFSSFSPEKLATVYQHLKQYAYPENHTVCTEEEISSSMFFVSQGKVLITKKGVPLATLDEGSYFGEMSLLENKTRDATVVTIEPTTLFELSAEIFRKHIINEPSALLDIAITFDKRLRQHNLLVIEQYLELKKQYQELDESHKKLLQTEKLATIGTLAAGVAHEINNALTVVEGYTEILKKKHIRKEATADFCIDMLDRIKTASDAIKKITSGLTSYARMDTDSLVPVKLNEAVSASIDLVSYLYKRNGIGIETCFIEPDPEIMGNINQLQQVILNLFSNAAHAMDGMPVKKIKIHTTANGNSYCALSITDTGCGIKPEYRDKVFDKFFTTRKIGTGTGLGLDIIKNIIENMNGKIDVESDVGRGTTFKILLPAISG